MDESDKKTNVLKAMPNVSKESNTEAKQKTNIAVPTTSGLLTGVLLNSGLVLFRGSSVTVAQCFKFQQVGNVVASNGTVASHPMTKPCSQACVMFGEPTTVGNLIELEICCGRKLKFSRLFDLRGQVNDIDINKCEDHELFNWLEKNGIIQVNK